jgi:hypothetical protein
MAVIRRRNKKQNLIDIPTYISEEGIDSKYFQIFGIPEELTTGKSSFIVGGSPFLKSEVKLKLEILDSQGEVIYTEPVFGYREGVNRRVSIEIYDSKTAGEAVLTLLGEIDPVKSDVLIPSRWQGVYNVKYSRRISINPTLLNTQPIRFHKQPFVSISPLTNAFKEYIQQPEETRILTAELASDINVATSTQTTDPVTQEESYPEEDQADKAFDFMALYNQPAFRQSSFSNFRMPFKFQLFSPASGNSNLLVSSGSLDDGMIGQKVIINDPQVDTTSPDIPTTYTVPSQYSSSIIDITNDTTANLAKAFYVTGEDGSTKYPVNLLPNQSFTCSFSPVPTEQDSVINYFDLADITISRLRTFSGDIKFVRVFSISQGSQTEQQFDFHGEFPLESQELLFDYNNIKSGRTGFFFNQEKINSYWHAYGGTRATTASGSGEPADSIQLAQTGSIIRYSMDISGSNAGLNQEIMVQTSQSFSLSKSVPYEVSFKAYGSRQSKTTSTGDKQKARIDFFMSGSNFNPNHQLGGNYGRRILTVDFDDSVEYPELQNLVSYDWNKNYLSGMFIPLQGGTGKLQIRVSSGRWHISDVSLRPSADTNFSPETARIFAEMPPSRNRPDSVKFLLEFVNNDGVKADSVILSPEITFPGANFAIQGDNNVLSGSMFISNAIGEGIEMAGLSSAFLRTIGWEGFNSASNAGKGGFIIYSGSVLPDSPDNYKGAGLEIHDGNSGSSERFFQFRTDDGTGNAIFKVKTDDYLFGISGSGGVESYISGADGKLEISSSNFSISNTGDVNMSGVVTATSGKIGDWTISSGNIVGSNITMDADSSRIYKTDSNGELDGYYMDFTPGSNYYVRFGTDFAVSSSGTLIASGAIIEGVLTSSEGLIANWTIGSDTVSKLSSTKYTGISSAGDTRFFAGADTLAASGSAPFNVKASGDLTASNYLFNGSGLITGSVTIGKSATILGSLSAESIHVPTSTAPNYLSEIHSSGYARFVSASIGGWDVQTTLLKSSDGNIRLNANAKKITIHSHSFGNEGMQFDYNAGNPRFYVGDGDQNYLRFDSSPDPDTGVQIKTAIFSLKTDNLIISSSQNDGMITFGSTPPTAYNSGNGIYMDGTGKLLIGSGSGKRIQFDGSDFDVQVGALELDASNIELSSAEASMSLGEGKIVLDGGTISTITVGDANKIHITGSANLAAIRTGKISATDTTTSGFWLANNSTDPEFYIGNAADTAHIKFDGGNASVKTGTFELDANNLEISSTESSMSLGEGKIVLDGGTISTISVGSGTDKKINITGSATLAAIRTGKISATDTTTSGFWLANNNSDPEFYIGNAADTAHIKFDGGNTSVKTGTFELDATNIEISSTQKSMSLGEGAIRLVGAATSTLTVGSTAGKKINITGSSDRGVINTGKESLTDTTAGFWLANVNGTPQFNVGNSTSFIKFTGTDMTINSRAFELSASNLEISSTNASMSIGPATSPYILLDGTSGVSANESYISVGSHATRRINISGSATAGVINTGKESVNDTTSGFWLANNNGNVEVNIGSSTNFMKLSSDDFTLNVDQLDIDATDIEVSSTQASASFGHDSAKGALVLQGEPARLTIVSGSKSDAMASAGASGSGQILRIGDITDSDAGDKFGLMMFDGTGTDVETDRILSLGDRGNVIGGWEITTGQIRAIPDAGVGENYADSETKMIIHSAGRIETSDFATGLKGWRIDSAGNGTAEFENARIRGTLRTTVFEKESVNVVGGQLMVANSTVMEPLLDQSGSVLAGAASMSAADVTMSCANVSGFAVGEIIKTKKVGNTGFSVEYMYISGSQRYSAVGSPYSASIATATSGGNMGANDPDGLAGELYVHRAYGSVVNVSSSIGTVDTEIPTTVTYETFADIILDLGSNYVVTQSILKIDSERFKVTSASNGLGSTGNNQTIRVKRDYHETDPAVHTATTAVYLVDPDKEFLAGLISTAQSYNEGQVIVSTGKFDATKSLTSGYILMNANPQDISTPYMDIVERTGSGVYDLQLRARLGDLSGLSSGYLYGEEEPGFGLYTDNGYFRGTIQAMTGSIHGILNVATTAGGIETGDKIMIGRNVDGSSDGINIDSSNYWYTTGAWKVGGTSNYLSLDSAAAGNIDIAAETFRLRTSTFIISSSLNSGTLRLGSNAGPTSATDTSNTGVYFDGTGKFAFVKDSDEYIRYDGTALETRVKELNLVAGNMTLSGSSTSYMKVGTLTGVTDTGATRKGFWVDNDGNMLLKGGTANTDYIKVASGGAVTIKSQLFDLETTGLDIIGTSGTAASNKIRLGAAATNNDAFAGNSTGIYMDGGGNFRIGDATSANYFKVSAGGSVTIATDTFELAATDIDISTTSKFIKIGEGQIVLQGGVSSSATSSITVGSGAGKQMEMAGSATEAFIKSGKHHVDDTSNAGFWLANHNGQPEFYISDGGDNEHIRFDGGAMSLKSTTFELSATDLDMSSTNKNINLGEGDIILQGATDATSSITVGTTAGKQMVIGGSATEAFIKSGKVNVEDTTNSGFWIANHNADPEFYLGDGGDNEFIKFDGGTLEIKAQNVDITSQTFKVESAAGLVISALDLSTAGNNYISLGTLGDVTTVNNTNRGFRVDGDGNILIKAGTTANKDYLKFASSGLSIRTANMDLQAGGINIVGTSATSASNYIKVGAVSSATDAADASTGVFIDGDGNFLAKAGASGSGFIQAASGDIAMRAGNFDLQTTGLKLVGTTAAGASNYMAFGSMTSATDASNTGVWMDGAGGFGARQDALNYIRFNSSVLEVGSSNLNVQAGGINIVGTSGTSGSNYIKVGGMTSATDASNTGIWMDGGGGFGARQDALNYIRFNSAVLEVGSSNLNVQAGGVNIVGTSGTSGSNYIKIGGMTSATDASNTGIWMDGAGGFGARAGAADYMRFNSSKLELGSTNFSLTSSGLVINTTTISLGTITTSSDTDGTGTYFDTSGNFRVQGDTNNYLRIAASGAIAMKADDISFASTTFSLTTDTLKIQSGVNSGKIALGASATIPTAYNTGKGVYLDGTGKALIGNAGGSYINFDGTDLVINTTNFSLSAAGDVSMRGTVTADAGDVGGFTIAGGKLSAESGGDTLLIQSAASGSQKMQLSDSDGALAIMRFGNLTLSASLGGALTYNTAGQANPYSAVAGSTGVCIRLMSTSTLHTSGDSGLFEFNAAGTNQPLIAVSSGDGGEAESAYIFRIVLNSTVSASLWEDDGSGHSDHDSHELTGTGRVTYHVNVFNKTDDVVIANANAYTIHNVDDFSDTGTTDQLTGGTWYGEDNTVTLEGSFTNAADFGSDKFEYQVTCSVTTMNFDNTYVTEGGGGSSATENANASVGTKIVSFLCEPNSKVTEITPKGIQTVHTTTVDSEKYFIVDHTKDDTELSGDDPWFISSAGNFRHYGNIYATDDIYAYYSSDLRLKKDIELIEDPIDKIKQMRGISFSWNEKKPIPEGFHNPRELGVIAQEVLSAIPEVVRKKRDGYYGVKYEQLIPVLVEGIKEQQEQIEVLQEHAHEPQNYKEKCDKMEERIKLLEGKLNSMACGSLDPT